MKMWKKILIRFGYGVIGLCALGAVGWFMPFPIEGNWGNGEWPYGFLRFENGKILAISEDLSPPCWIGTYKKTGWGKYEIKFLFGIQSNPVVFRSTILQINMYVNVDNRWIRITQTQEADLSLEGISDRRDTFTRNFSVLTCQKILNDPENEWVQRPREMYYRVSGTVEERSFALGSSVFVREQIENYLNTLLKNPVPIYTASNDVPACVIDILTQNGLDYQVHSNQQWVTDEWEWESRNNNPDASPLWTNSIPKIIIRLPTDNDKEEDPAIYYWDGESTFEHLKHKIEQHRKHRDLTKNDFYLYVKDDILPEDVREMFGALGINYRVLDEKILYRGKKRK